MRLQRSIVVYGNCQAGALFSIFSNTARVTNDFDVKYHDLWPDEARLKKEVAEIENCDVLILQSIRNWETHPLNGKIPRHVKVIQFPFLYMAALWPFDAFVFGQDYPMLAAKASMAQRGYLNPFGFEDGLVAKLRVDSADTEVMFQKYLAMEHQSIPDIKRYARLETMRLTKLDRDHDFKIGDFIIQNFRERRLFHALIHPTWELQEMLAREVFSKIGYSLSDIELPKIADYCSTNQVPLHPRVISELGLQWARDDDMYNILGVGKVDFSGYFKGYCEYIENTSA